MEDLIRQIEEKYKSLQQNPETYLRGLLHSKPLNYWDYVQLEPLLNLQSPRTNFPDEMIFIIYHQITELILKLIRHELEQIVFASVPTPVFAEKMERCTRYADILTSSFAVMSQDMSYEQYHQFRLALAPASGFQSAQFREIEILSTDLENLVKEEFRGKVTSIEKAFDYVYWQDAGLDRRTGQKSLTLLQFEEKYLAKLIALSYRCKDINLNRQFTAIPSSDPEQDRLIKSLRTFDYIVNIKWPLVHLNTAETYLIEKGIKKEATGMSDWQKYLHPSWQRRVFFPKLWSDEELKNWGNFTI